MFSSIFTMYIIFDSGVNICYWFYNGFTIIDITLFLLYLTIVNNMLLYFTVFDNAFTMFNNYYIYKFNECSTAM